MAFLRRVVETGDACEAVDFDERLMLRRRDYARDGDSAAGSSARDGREQQLSRLVRTIEGEIIPRLMLSEGRERKKRSIPVAGDVQPSVDQIETLARLSLGTDGIPAYKFIADAIATGMSRETVLLGLIGPAAQRLGKYWEDDLRDFLEVTMGLSRLQHLVHEFGPAAHVEVDPDTPPRRALLATAPGEQHGLGVVIVEEFFRRGGWDVCGGPLGSSRELVDLARTEWFDLLGLSSSCDASLDAVTALIKTVRRTSRNRAIFVMVGGRVFNDNPDYVARVGADATAVDPRLAILQTPKVNARKGSRR